MLAPVTFDARPYALPPSVTSRLQSPALVVFLDQMRGNVRRVIKTVDGDPGRWRPHVKTVKIPVVFGELLEAGLRAFKCATTREADHLLRAIDEAGVRDGDLLLAHPLIGPGLERLGRLARAHEPTRVSVLCDDPAAVEHIPTSVSIFVDVNAGMNRTGVPLEQADDIVTIARRAGRRFRGVHFYEGHLHGRDSASVREQAFALFDRLEALVDRLRQGGVNTGEVITSGSPTFAAAIEHPGLRGIAATSETVHRVSPGTVVFHDVRSEEEFPELGLHPAALVFTRVVSQPSADIVTCDAGSKSVTTDAGHPCAAVIGHPELEALVPTEEHLPLRVHGGALPTRGTPLLLVPRHVCPCVNLAEDAILVEGDGSARQVPVSARAHDMFFRPDDAPSVA